jgi:hypothetical protein
MWVDNIKMDIGKNGIGVIDCISVAQDRTKWRAIATVVINLRVP